MSYFRGPQIVREGLILQFDPANIKCFRGEPTVNYVVLASTMGNCGSYSNGNDGTFLTEFGTIGYRITHRTSWNGLYTGISIPIAGTYTISAYFRYLGGTANNNGATVYTSGGGIPDSAVVLNKSLVGVWQRVSMTNTYTGSFTFYMISYGGNTSDWSSWEVTMPQVEQKDHATPFVNGTRGTTVATGGGLIDLSNNGNHGEIVNNILYDSNNCGSLKFDGINNYLKTNFSLNTNPSSFDIWFYIDDIPTSNQILFINQYNNTALGFYNTNYFILSAQAVFKRIASNTTLNSHSWNNVIVTYDINGLPYCHINGIETTYSNTNYWNSVARPLLIGCRESSSNNYDTFFTGKIGLFKIYNRQLTQSEIQQNYNSTKTRFNNL